MNCLVAVKYSGGCTGFAVTSDRLDQICRDMDIILRFAIAVVFYEITNVQCVYCSNTAIFIGRI